MNETIYEDERISVTPTEIRAKGFVLYVENISSISVTTIRPAKWASLLMAVPILVAIATPVYIHRLLRPFLGQETSAVLFPIVVIPILPICLIVVLGFLFRFSRLSLQTNGGPVLLGWSFSFSEPYSTLAKYNSIKEAIETAMDLRKITRKHG